MSFVHWEASVVHILRLCQLVFVILLWLIPAAPGGPNPKMGASSVIITEAVRLGQPVRV